MQQVWASIVARGPAPVRPNPPPRDLVYRFRSHPAYRTFAETMSQKVFPFVFGMSLLLALVWTIAGTANRAVFAAASAIGQTCRDAAPKAAAARWTASFPNHELCYATGIPIEQGLPYRMSITLPDGGWRDGGHLVRTAAGFGSGERLAVLPFLPFRRVLTAQWFVPMARIGANGAEYHHLAETPTEFTPRMSGQLFLFVNDAIGPGPLLRWFYDNNDMQRATVTVEQVLPANATATPPAP
jgi:hypothetical protein